MSAYDEITEALAAAGSMQKGHDWTCPVHKGGGEKSPSLSVNEGDKGVVMICHHGCDNADILKHIGKRPADMFDEKPQQKKIVATYDYKNDRGELVYQVVRYDPKEFRQRQPDGAGGWKWSVKGVHRVPYRLPALLDAVANGDTIYVCEGEKDADAFNDRGFTATCNSGGAGKWSDDFAQYFKGAANVIVVADNDEPGFAHADQVGKSLANVGVPVTLSMSMFAKDPYDHFLAGHDVNEFMPIAETPTTPERVNPLRSRLLAIDDIDNLPPPMYLINDFIVADSLAVIYGQPGHGKSFVALDWALHMAHGLVEWMNRKVMAGPVIYLVAEGLSGYGIRKKSWRQAHPVFTAGDLHWLRDPVNLLDKEAVADFIELCDEMQPMMVVVDTLARCMPGADENAPGPMSDAIEALDTIRRNTKACVLVVHHSPKDGGTPRGHSSLMGAVQTAIKCHMQDGVITLSVEKQKDGPPTEMKMRLSSLAESAVLEPLGDGPLIIPKSLMTQREIETIVADMSVHGGVSVSVIMEKTTLSKSRVYDILADLVTTGKVARHGQRYVKPDLLNGSENRKPVSDIST